MVEPATITDAIGEIKSQEVAICIFAVLQYLISKFSALNILIIFDVIRKVNNARRNVAIQG